MLQALHSENIHGELVVDELTCACNNLPPETSMNEAASSCSAVARQVQSLVLAYLCGVLSAFNMGLTHIDAQATPGICRWMVNVPLLMSGLMSACAQFAAVLHQLDVRVKDFDLWGFHWLLATHNTSFLEVRTQIITNATAGGYLMLSLSSHVVLAVCMPQFLCFYVNAKYIELE